MKTIIVYDGKVFEDLDAVLRSQCSIGGLWLPRYTGHAGVYGFFIKSPAEVGTRKFADQWDQDHERRIREAGVLFPGF